LGTAVGYGDMIFLWFADGIAILILLTRVTETNFTQNPQSLGAGQDAKDPAFLKPLLGGRFWELAFGLWAANLIFLFFNTVALESGADVFGVFLRSLGSIGTVTLALLTLIPVTLHKRECPLSKLATVVRILLGAGIIAPFFGSFFEALSYWPSFESHDFFSPWFLKTISSLTGFCLLLPFLLVLFRLTPADISVLWQQRGRETLFMICAASLLAFATFLAPSHWVVAPVFHFLFFPITLWAASRFGPMGTACLIAILGCFTLYGAVRHSLDPFILSEAILVKMAENFAFLAAHITVGLVAAAILSERDRALKALVHSHDELEKIVADRTAELRHRNSALKHEVFQFRGKETELRAREETLRSLVQGLPLPMMVIRLSDAKILHMNMPAAALFKIKPHLALSRKTTDFFCYPAQRDRHVSLLKETGRLENVELLYRDQEGRSFWGLVNALAISYRGEEAALATILDIDSRKEQERALRDAKLQAEAANTAKSDFLATMSHEIRTPLNGVIGMAERLAQTSLTPDQQEHLDLIRISGEALLSLIGDILDLAKIETGHIHLTTRPFALKAFCHDITRLIAIQTDKKGLIFETHISDDLPDNVLGDDQRLRQILLNLLANAVKFTHQGQVKFSVHVQAATDKTQSDTYLFTICDTGIGISAADSQRLFEPFVQVDSSETRSFEGSGLGLAISQKLARAMGGSITVQSKIGEGSLFSLSLPLASHETKAPFLKSIAKEKAPPLSVLVVEDNLINQEVLSGLLEMAGHHPTIVGNGEKALSAIEEDVFDVILMDLRMPGMDGLEVTRRIRQRTDNRNTHSPIIAVTANTRPEDVAKAFDAGMNHFIGKPIKPERLDEVLIEAWLNLKPSGLPPIEDKLKVRPQLTHPIFNHSKAEDLAKTLGRQRAEALFEGAHTDLSPLLEDFCSAMEAHDCSKGIPLLKSLKDKSHEYCLEQLAQSAATYCQICESQASPPAPDFIHDLATRSLAALDSWRRGQHEGNA